MAEKKKVGRPKFQIDYETVEKLAHIQCTKTEIANFLGCSVDTLDRENNFAEHYKKGLDGGKMSLRRMQFKLAEKNSAMAIFLGKQYLGQKDNPDENGKDNKINNNILNIANLLNNPMPNRSEKDVQ